MDNLRNVFPLILTGLGVWTAVNLNNAQQIATQIGLPLHEASVAIFALCVGAVLWGILQPILTLASGGTETAIPAMIMYQRNVNDALDKMTRLMETEKEKKEGKPKLKATAPTTFSGKSEDVVPFISACSSYFEYEGETQDRVKIHFVINNLFGNTATNTQEWAKSQFRRIEKWRTEGHARGEPFIWKDWAEFEKDFKSHFCLRSEKEASEKKLKYWKMTKGMTCEEYTTEFNSLQMSTDFNDEYYYMQYTDGLTEALMDKLCANLQLKKGDLEAWKQAAVEMDRRFQERKLDKSEREAEVRYKVVEKIIYRDRPTQKDPNAMEVDAVQTQKGKVKNLDAEDKSKWKCVKCNGLGHGAYECPTATCNKCRKRGHTERAHEHLQRGAIKSLNISVVETRDEDFQ